MQVSPQPGAIPDLSAGERASPRYAGAWHDDVPGTTASPPLAGIALLVSRGGGAFAVGIADRQARRGWHLSERMPVRGGDNMARLAGVVQRRGRGSLSRQIAQLEEFSNHQRGSPSDVSHGLCVRR